MDASSLLSYITTACLGQGKWKGTTHAFILHWQDQVRKYHDLAQSQTMSFDLQRTMLENAVHPIAELRAVKAQADQLKTHTGKGLSYEEYCSLLLSAAQQYDKQFFTPAARPPRRQVYEYQTMGSIDSDVFYDGESFDIDSHIDVIEAYATDFRSGPRLTRNQWHRLPDSAKKTWDMLTPDAKSIILEPCPPPDPHNNLGQRPNTPRAPTRPPPPPPPRCQIHEHDIDNLIAYLHDLRGGSSSESASLDHPPDDTDTDATSDHEAQPDGLLAHLTKQNTLPPGNVKRLLSQTANKANPSTKPTGNHKANSVTFREANNVSIMYQVLAYDASVRKGALVDRGANCGIAGEEVRVIAKTGRQVDVQGIDNHQIVNIPIVTAGAVVNTQKGPVIAIMHQYAYTGKGKTIHSSAQMEAYKQVVHDKSLKVGGKQRIETLDGYIIPLNIRSGLPYMSMRPYTDKEWQDLPHVMLTGDDEWVPSILDSEIEDNEEWFNAMEDLPVLTEDALFDEFGDYRKTHEVTEAIMADSIIENSVITDLPSVFKLYANEVMPREIDYDKFKSKFMWLPTDVIKRTFDKTTQHYRMSANTYLKKRYKSPFPAFNVHRHEEPVATDTVYSYTLAIDCGVTSAQFFCRTESLVCDIYPMKTDKQFVNTLQDNIRRQGAMSKLISDHAQLEVSNKVKDIL